MGKQVGKNKFAKYDIKQGIFLSGNFTDDYSWLIVNKNDVGIKIVPVHCLHSSSILYNNSSDKCHQHNVPLYDSPPPFSELHSKVYCFADLSSSVMIPFSKFDELDIHISDSYKTISDKDYDLVLHHSLEQKELQKVYDGHFRELPEIDYGGEQNEGAEFE